MTTTNKYTDTTSVDYLEAIKRNQIESLNANSSSANFNLTYMHTMESEFALSNSFTNTEQTIGDYQITDESGKVVSYFPFDYVTDSTYGSITGTITGSETYIDGPLISPTHPLRKAIDFDGTTNYLTISNESSFDFEYTSPFSVSFWINMDSIAADQGIIVKSNDLTTGLGWKIYFQNTSDFLVFKLADGTNAYSVTSTTGLGTYNWYHVVCTYSGGSNQSGMKIYVNGTLETTGASSAISSTILNNVSLVFGAESDAGSKLDGALSDVWIYNVELSSTDVTTLYAGKQPTKNNQANSRSTDIISNLALLYRFEDNVSDSSTNGNTGTVTGTTTYVTNGKYGKSFSFNGTSYIDVADETDYDRDITDAFSISLWVKNTSTVLDVYVSKETNLTSDGYSFYQNPTTGYPEFRIRTSTPAGFIITSSTAVNDGNWHHVVATKSTASNRSGMKIYIDGSLNVTGTTSPMSGSMLNAIQVRVGALADGTQVYTGEMDDVRIYTKELSSTEVTTLYNSAPIAYLGLSDIK